MGVDVFFVISGFLITGILTKNERVDIAGFYQRRVRRIFPALTLLLCCVLIVGWTRLLADEFAELARESAAGAAFVSNLYLWSQVSYFDVSATQKPLLHLWSLGVEEQFYLLWPLLIWGCRRVGLTAWPFIGVLTAASFAWSLDLTWSDQTAAFYSPATRLWELGIGGLLALHPPRLSRTTLISATGAALVLAAFVVFDGLQAFPGLWVLMPVLGTGFIIAAGRASAVNRLLSFQPLVWVGLISYPLYLWHWPLLSFATMENNLEPPSVMARVLLLGAAAVLSVATYVLIERPMRKGRALPLIVAMTAVFGASLAIVAAHGLPARPINRDERKAFVASYQRLQLHGLGKYYREECDFVRWGTYAGKKSIALSCVQPGARGTYFLWGDSHAEALAYGLRRALPQGFTLAQVTTSGCKPWTPVGDPESAHDPDCIRSNEFALREIRRLQPAIVFLAQKDMHEERDWDRLGTTLLRAGAQTVVLVGPLPEWKPSLPRVVAAHEWPLRSNYVAVGLQRETFRTDAIMRRRRMHTVRYISIVQHFCRAAGCLARVGSSLMAVDYGHLTPAGSRIVGRFILEQTPSVAMRKR